MKIAQIAPPYESIPPTKHGGTERIVYSLTEELVAMGHDVTLFASGDSVTSAKLAYTSPQGFRKMYPHDTDPVDDAQRTVAFFEHLVNAYNQGQKFDIIHDHTSLRSFPIGLTLGQQSAVPVVTTLHSALSEKNIAWYEKFSNPYLVAISNAQVKLAPQLHYASVVYNGLDMHAYPFVTQPQKYLLYVGRITQQKGVHNAITVARKLDMPLIIAARLDEDHVPYFEKHVKSYLDDKIRWIGEVDETERNELMSNALCFLHPLEWEEPFGLTIIESMACGTPVVAFNRGSMKEIIDSGKTGYVVDTLDEMVAAIKKIDRIDRAHCRDYSRGKFSSRRMAKDYEMVYETILSMQQPTFPWLANTVSTEYADQ